MSITGKEELNQHKIYERLWDRRYIEDLCKKQSVDEFVHNLHTGDIIYARSESFFGKIIQTSGHCIWNHVALCVVHPQTNEKYWWECTNAIDNVNMPEQSNPVLGGNTGTRLWHIKNRLTFITSGGENKQRMLLGVAKFIPNTTLWPLMDTVAERKLAARLFLFMQKEAGKAYQPSFWVIFLSWFDGLKTLKNYICYWNDTHSIIEESTNDWSELAAVSKDYYFCSQLIIETLKQCGFFDDTIPKSHEWTVMDIVNVDNLNTYLPSHQKYQPIEMFLIH